MCDAEKEIRLGEHAEIVQGFPFASNLFSDKNGYPLIRIRDLLSQCITTFYQGNIIQKAIVKDFDILIGMDGDFNAVTWRGGCALLNQRIARIVSNSLSLNNRYLFHWLQPKLNKIHAQTSQTTVRHLSRFDIENIKLPAIPHPEQTIVGAILDTVDEAIRRIEALIAKLRQVKAGMLQDLLTRGLDENGELRDPVRHPEQFKDSPLGRIPMEWEIRPLWKIAKVSSGVTLGNNPQGTGTIELPYLRVANVQDGYLYLSDIKKIRIFKKDIDRFALQKGDVLMNEGGDYDKLGRGAVWDGQIEPCLHQNHVFRVRPIPEFLNSYFLDAVSGSQYGKNYFLLSSKQSTNLASINSTQLNNFPIPCPAMDEQKTIVSIVSEQDHTIGVETVMLGKLKRLKQGLMQDLLTGHVRVSETMIRKYRAEA